MKTPLSRVVFAVLVVIVALLSVRLWIRVRERIGSRPEFADVVTRIDLELDLRAPPKFVGKARLALREGTQGRIRFLLNRDLDVVRASDEGGREIDWEDEGRLRSDHHKEARVIAVHLPGPTRELVLEYEGEGLDRSSKRDWMGVLRLAPDELRMSMQTVFYPQIPLDLDGPDPLPWPAHLRVLAPPGLEAYAPGKPVECGAAWCWESDTPSVLSLFAAARVRHETQLGEARVITLLTERHAALGEEIAREAESMLRFYAGLWGPIGPRTLGVVEFKTSGNSYNWTSEGIIAMESGAFGDGVPLKTLAHEVAHLWWGQETCASGRGERFLTEGLAEFAAWRYVQSVQGASAAEALAREAEQSWWTSVHETGVDPALFDVRFGTKGYSQLAYDKGAVALWKLQRKFGEAGIDAVLRAYREAPTHGAEDFLAALRERAGGTTIDLALLEQEGHAHLELAGVTFEGASARGRVHLARCPAKLPAPRLEELGLAVHLQDSVLRQSVRAGTRFEVNATGPIQGLALDPDGLLAGAHPAPVLAPGVGFVSSEPADGAEGLPLGPFAARLRFGTPLGAPPPGFAETVQQSCLREAREKKIPVLSVMSVALEDDARTLAIGLEGTSPDCEYVLVVPEGLATAHGLPLPALRLRFRTRDAEGAPRPRIVSTDPPEGARDVPVSLSRLKVVFSEPMRMGRGFKQGLVDDLEDDGWAYPHFGESRWEDARTLIWEFEGPLEPGKRYGLPFDTEYRSQLGIALERFDLHFETAR